jgi:hypothetical protein
MRRFQSDKGLAQTSLADLVGMSLRAIQCMEGGEFRPFKETVLRFQRVEENVA